MRKYSASVHRRAKLYSDISRIDDTKATKSLSNLSNVSSPGKKIQRAGFIMLWVPEPTGVTIALGAPMILAGRYIEKKYNSATVSDIGHNANSMVSDIANFKNFF